MRAVAFSRDGTRLAAAGGLPARKGEVKIWDVARAEGTRDHRRPLRLHLRRRVLARRRAARDRRLRPLIKLWDVATGKEIRTLRDHIDAIYALAFTPDGKRLVTGAADRSVKVWDVATGTRLYTLSESTDAVNTIAISPDGKRVAAGGRGQDHSHLAARR